MKKIITTAIITLLATLVLCMAVGMTSMKQESVGYITQTSPTYTTASSTAYSVGHQLSTKVLDAYGRRAYARFCNVNDAQDMYLVSGTTQATATTSAFTVVEYGECYEITNDNLLVSQINVITDSSTTTNDMLVYELRD